MSQVTRQQVRIEQSGPRRIPFPIAVTGLTTAAQTLFDNAADGSIRADFLVSSLWVTNQGTTDRTVDIYLVPEGASAGTGNAFIYQQTVPASSTLYFCTLNETVRLSPDETLQALSSNATDLVIGGWGEQIVG